MAERRRIPTVITLPPPPRRPEDCPEWAQRFTVALQEWYRRLSPESLVSMERVPDGQFLQRSGTTVVGSAGGGSGTVVTVGGSGLASTTGNFSDTTPAAPGDSLNVKWQKDGSSPTNISAYVPLQGVRDWRRTFLLMGA